MVELERSSYRHVNSKDIATHDRQPLQGILYECSTNPSDAVGTCVPSDIYAFPDARPRSRRNVPRFAHTLHMSSCLKMQGANRPNSTAGGSGAGLMDETTRPKPTRCVKNVHHLCAIVAFAGPLGARMDPSSKERGATSSKYGQRRTRKSNVRRWIVQYYVDIKAGRQGVE